MVTTVNAYVDPRPIRPPTMGLVASANNVVDGSDFDLNERVNPSDVISETASGAADLISGGPAPGDMEYPARSAPIRWINGFAYRPEVCNGGGTLDHDATSLNAPSPIAAEIDVRPFLVEGSDVRSTFGTPDPPTFAEARAFARRQLLACESKQIARVLWTGKLTSGALSTNRYLADSNVSLVEGDRLLGWTTALAALERAIKAGTCGQQGMIHARADTVSIWDQGGALRRVGNLILTIHDTIVVADAGYDGSAPAATTVGLDPNHAGVVPSTDSAWAYATTVIDLRRSDFITPQTVLERTNQSTNTLTTFERRVAAATWGCLQAGVHVDHLNSISTTGS